MRYSSRTFLRLFTILAVTVLLTGFLPGGSASAGSSSNLTTSTTLTTGQKPMLT